VTQLYVEVMPKRLELAHELVPTATIIAALVNPTNPNTETILRDLQAAAASSECNYKSCMPAPNAISIRSSQPWPNCEPALS
jgi:hypothetical protein